VVAVRVNKPWDRAILGLMHVRTCNGTKIADLGAHPPEALARILMMELAQEQTPYWGEGWVVEIPAK
jgi:hypothetical protein